MIDFEQRDELAVITINRPEKLNALDAHGYRELSQAWVRVRDDDRIRAAVITGAGDRAFCAGADITSSAFRDTGARSFWNTQHDMLLNRGLEVWKPVIAAVHGYCLGGGLTLLLATDIRVATPNAVFGLSEVKRGTLPANGGTQRILRQLPHAVGMEMLLTGAEMDAAAAERWGLVNRVVPTREELIATAVSYARTAAANAPLAVQAAKEAAIRGYELGWNSGLRFEQAMARVLMHTADAAEGSAAFAEKRAPRFKGV